jgi:hypothetical protein
MSEYAESVSSHCRISMILHLGKISAMENSQYIRDRCFLFVGFVSLISGHELLSFYLALPTHDLKFLSVLSILSTPREPAALRSVVALSFLHAGPKGL